MPLLWDVESRRIRYHVKQAFFAYLGRAFAKQGLVNSGKLLIEVGCARSVVLPLLAKKLGFTVAGLDYSPNGCEQARAILRREGVMGEIYCCDIYAIPEDLNERFDVVVSFGLVEHFADTTAVVAALARLLKPGGLIFTSVPNLRGAMGLVQRALDRATYDIHVPLSAVNVRQAHENAGLHVIECDYFLSTNFGVLNVNAIRPYSMEWLIKRLITNALTGVSVVAWWIERLVGNLPTGQTFSPYVNCVAVKPLIRQGR